MKEKVNRIYKIQLQTSVGPRYGFLTCQVRNDRISGELDILKHVEPFFGKIDADGNCEFSGQIITLMWTINYVATGVVTADHINLTLLSEQGKFYITGEMSDIQEETIEL